MKTDKPILVMLLLADAIGAMLLQKKGSYRVRRILERAKRLLGVQELQLARV